MELEQASYRYAVKKFLDSHPKVQSYTDAHPSQGGFGAKVIRLLALKKAKVF